MSRRRMADVSTGALTGAGAGAAAGAAGGPYGALAGGAAGALLGGFGAYYASEADEPFDAAELEAMRLGNKLTAEQLEQIKIEKQRKKRMDAARRMFSQRVGTMFAAAKNSMPAGRSMSEVV